MDSDRGKDSSMAGLSDVIVVVESSPDSRKSKWRISICSFQKLNCYSVGLERASSCVDVV